MVAVIDILRIRFAGVYTAVIAAIETNRRITPKEIIGNCHTADGKCPAIRKSYSDLLSGKPIAQPTTHPKTALSYIFYYFSFQNHSPKNSYSKFANYNYFLCFFKFRLFKLNIFFCTYINIKLILNIQTIN